MKTSRRQFLLAIASLSLTACGKEIKLGSRQNLILGGGQFLAPGNRSIEFVLSMLELDQHQQHVIPMSFLPHGIHRNPYNSDRLAIFEKIGPGACEFDMASRQIVKPLEAIAGHRFYGHGAYSKNGDVLYATESSISSEQGVISVRDVNDHSVLGKFPSYGKAPHECKLIDKGKTMIVTNGGGAHGDAAPSLSYIDVASEALLEKITLRNQDVNAGHVAISASGDAVVVSAPRAGMNQRKPGGVSMGVEQGEMLPAQAAQGISDRLFGEALSVAIHESNNIVAVTHPEGNLISIWSLTNKRLIKTLQLPGPRGVELTTDESAFIVSFGSEASVLRIPITTLEPDHKSTHTGTFITGSHIYNWSRELHELAYSSGLHNLDT